MRRTAIIVPASVLLLVGLSVAVLQWAHIGYRVKLFRDYGSKPYVNHVADGTFKSAYMVNVLVIAAGVIALYLLEDASHWARLAAWCPLILNLAGLAMLVVMRGTGMLVEYNEFVKHLGP